MLVSTWLGPSTSTTSATGAHHTARPVIEAMIACRQRSGAAGVNVPTSSLRPSSAGEERATSKPTSAAAITMIGNGIAMK